MTALEAIAALAGAGLMLGLSALLSGLRKQPDRYARPDGRVGAALARARRYAGLSGTARERQARRVHLLAVLVAGAGAYLLSGIPALALLAAYAVLGAPLLLQTGKAPARRIALQSGLGQWTRALSVRIATGSGLEQALIASAKDAPDAVTDHLQSLAARLEAGWAASDALSAFATEAADPTADYIATALRRASIRRGPGLASVLDRLSAGVEARVRMWQKIEAERARVRTTVRLINVIVLAMFVGLQFDHQFMAPYHSAVGQLVLIALAGAYTGCLALMDRLTRGRPEPRLLGPDAQHAPDFRTFGRTA